MKFASTRLIAADIKALVSFYEKVTGQKAEWLAPVFAEIVTPAATLAIGSAETVALFKEGSAEPAANRNRHDRLGPLCPNRRHDRASFARR